MIFYIIILKNVSIWLNISVIHEILLYLVKKLMITCSDVFLQDQEHSIKQIMKEINRFKNNIVSDKVLTTHKLSSDDILIIMNITKIKKQLKHSKCWLSAVNQFAKINHHKFTVLMHEVCMFILDCSKQNVTIKKLLNQNQHFWNRIKVLHIYWFRKAVKLDKSVSYLIVNIVMSAQINLLIDNRLLFHSELKNCEFYHDDCRLI